MAVGWNWTGCRQQRWRCRENGGGSGRRKGVGTQGQGNTKQGGDLRSKDTILKTFSFRNFSKAKLTSNWATQKNEHKPKQKNPMERECSPQSRKRRWHVTCWPDLLPMWSSTANTKTTMHLAAPNTTCDTVTLLHVYIYWAFLKRHLKIMGEWRRRPKPKIMKCISFTRKGVIEKNEFFNDILENGKVWGQRRHLVYVRLSFPQIFDPPDC